MDLAVDIGGSYLRYELIDTQIKGSIPVKGMDIIKYLKTLVLSNNVKRMGVSFAGWVLHGKIIGSPNVALKNFEFKDYFSKLGVAVEIENDLYCAAIAESEYFDCKNLVVIYSGTGLGCGAVIDGRPLKGEGYACEIGHFSYKKAPFKCGCGKDNCLELYASGSAIKRWGKYKKIKDINLSQLYRLKNEIAIWYIDALSYAVGAVVSVLNPELIVLGGGVIKDNDFVVDEVRLKAKKYALKEAFDNLKIEMSRLENGSLEGAKCLIR